VAERNAGGFGPNSTTPLKVCGNAHATFTLDTPPCGRYAHRSLGAGPADRLGAMIPTASPDIHQLFVAKASRSTLRQTEAAALPVSGERTTYGFDAAASIRRESSGSSRQSRSASSCCSAAADDNSSAARRPTQLGRRKRPSSLWTGCPGSACKVSSTQRSRPEPTSNHKRRVSTDQRAQ